MPTLTCRNHPALLWMTKEMAITDGRYNGQRNLFFLGTIDDWRHRNFPSVPECRCPAADLTVLKENIINATA